MYHSYLYLYRIVSIFKNPKLLTSQIFGHDNCVKFTVKDFDKLEHILRFLHLPEEHKYYQKVGKVK
jgi:hypothetical protein